MKAAVKEPFFTLANVLTLSRLPLGVLAWVVPPKSGPLLALMGAAGVTDLLDGWAARHRRRRLGIEVTESAGVWLDPLCDKAFVVLMLSAIGARRKVAPELLAAIASREVLIAPLAVVYRLTRTLRRRGHRDFKAARIGKLTTVTQFLAMVTMLLDERRARPLALTAGGLGVISAGYYLRRAALAGLES